MNKFNDNLRKQLMSEEQAIKGSNNAIDPALSWEQYVDQKDAPLFVQPSELQSAEIADVNTSTIDKSNFMPPAIEEADDQNGPVPMGGTKDIQDIFAQKVAEGYGPDNISSNVQPEAPMSPQEKMMAEYKAMQEQDRKALEDARSSDRNLKMGGAIGDALATIVNARGQMNVKAPGVQVQQGAGLGKIADMFATAPDVASDLKNNREMLLEQYKQLQTGKDRELAERKVKAYEDQVKSTGLNKTKEKPSEGEKTSDREFAKVYNTWKTGGKSDFDQSTKIFEDAISKLENKEISTGTLEGIGSKFPGYRTETKELETRVRKALNTMLRATLGAQFTENEGEKIFQQTFDPSASPESNVANMKTELDRLKGKASDIQDQASYFEKNKSSLSGYQYGNAEEPKAEVKPQAKVGSIIKSKGKRYRVINVNGALEEVK